MIARRSHRKSKNGCIQCKSRKVKCDEGKPSCFNCTRHGVSCSFVSSQSGNNSANNSPGMTSEQAASPLNDQLDADMNMLELQLLHQYSTSTCYTISQDPISQIVWRLDVPKVGFTSGFVMRAIMALSALHLAHCIPSKRDLYVEKALSLHEIGLRQANKLMMNITKDNCTAVWLFSALTCLIACAKPRPQGDILLLGDRGLSDWLVLFRGSGFIVQTFEAELHSGTLASMFQIGTSRVQREQAGDDDARTAAVQEPLLELKKAITYSIQDQHVRDVSFDAIDGLAKSYAMVSNSFAATLGGGYGHTGTSVIFIWLLRIPDEYLSLLTQRSPAALAVFAYFCVLIKQLEWAWWMQGLSMHLIVGIYHSLEPEYRGWIQWPIEQIGWVPS